MSSDQINARALGFTVVALSIALEESLKLLAEKHDKRSGPWLDELQDLSLFRAQAHISERANSDEMDTVKAALAVAAHIFENTRSGYPST
jgi:hypothetical protein